MYSAFNEPDIEQELFTFEIFKMVTEKYFVLNWQSLLCKKT